MRKVTLSPLAARLDQLEISPEECAAVCRVTVETIERWMKTKSLGGEAAVLVRFLADPEDAARRVAQLRRTHTRDLRGEGVVRAGVFPAYGTADTEKTTGGIPS